MGARVKHGRLLTMRNSHGTAQIAHKGLYHTLLYHNKVVTRVWTIRTPTMDHPSFFKEVELAIQLASAGLFRTSGNASQNADLPTSDFGSHIG